MAIRLRRRTNDHLGALPSRCKSRRVPVYRQLPLALGALHSDLPHGAQDRRFLFIRGQLVQADLAGQLDIDREAVRQQPDALHQQRVRTGDGLGVDVAVEAELFPQNAQCFNHQLHRAVRRVQHRAGQEQPLDVVAAVEANGQLRQFPRGKSSPRAVVGAAVDAVAAIVGADVGIQHFQQRNAAAVRGKGMADARLCAAAQAAVLSGTLHAAGGAGHIIFGAVSQNFQLFRKIHRCFS